MKNNVNLCNDTVKSLLPKRTADSNKGTYGKVLVIAGCINYQGAAYLTALSALKVGCGLVTLASTEDVIKSVAAQTPCVTFLKLKSSESGVIVADAITQLQDVISNYDVIAVGPGLSVEPETQDFVINILELLKNSNQKVVIDADCINIIAKKSYVSLPRNAVMTPHPMEMARLFNADVSKVQIDRFGFIDKFVEKYHCPCVLKGHNTLISSLDDTIYVNTTGNNSMAKAGSGDVLTGIISGFLAQGVSVLNASILGVYLHGLCGDIARKNLTEYSVLPVDLIDMIPNAINVIIED